jgi:ligand-binding sensor domain-containing protein
MLSLPGCKGSAREQGAGSAPPPGSGASGSSEVKAPAAPIAVPKDVAYIGVEDHGLVRVLDGKAATLVTPKYPLKDLVVDPRGVAYAASVDGMWKIEGEKVTPMPSLNDQISKFPEQLAVGSDGTLWAAASQAGVYRFDGAKWIAAPAAPFATEIVYDLAVDGDRHVWVATSDDLWRFDGTSWQRVDKTFTKTDKPFFKSVVAAADKLYAGGHFGLFAKQGDAWKAVPVKGSRGELDVARVSVSADGRAAISGEVDEIALTAPGSAPSRIDFAKLGVNAAKAQAMAIDGSGRTWLATDVGVVIVGKDGALVQHWPPGTVEGISGEIDAIAVFGNGPTLPTLGTAARGNVTGKIFFAGKPVVGAAVEICASPHLGTAKTPCTGASVARSSVTDAAGAFTFTDVPVGPYGFAIKPKQTWFVTLGSKACCTSIESGKTFDSGTLTLDKLE